MCDSSASAAYLKFLHHKRRIQPRNFKQKSGTRINVFARAQDFPKFVKVGAAMVHEPRKVVTRDEERKKRIQCSSLSMMALQNSLESRG